MRNDMPARRRAKAARKLRLRLSVIAIFVVAAAFITGFAAVMLRPPQPGPSSPAPLSPPIQDDDPVVELPATEPIPPDRLLRLYFDHAEHGRFEEMYQMLTAISRESISQEDFVQRNRSIYEGIGAANIVVTVSEMYELPERPGRRFINYSLSMDTVAGEISHSRQVIFELDSENVYRLQWNTQMIFPELGNDDRVRVAILPAERGRIFDRNGQMLAGPGPASQVGLVPGRLRESDDEQEEDIARVAALLEMTPEAVMRRLGASYVREDTFVLLRTISRDAQALIDELLTVQGVLINSTTVRYYPLGRSAAHLVGYIQNINAEELEALRDEGYHMNSVIGRAGLESIYESQLRAIDGREIFIVDSSGNRTVTLARTPAVNGNDIWLTIDGNIQRRLYEQFHADNSASVAMNPLTGEVLALVSTPTYDPNDFVRGMTARTWAGLNENPNLPMFNRFRATFSPGSTMKAVTAAIGIETGVFTANEDFGPSGRRWQQDESWGRFFVTTVTQYSGPANLNNAMAWSDNIYFAKATLRIGADTFENGLRDFGFAERIPFEYGLFSSIISTTDSFRTDIQLADSGYGQGEILMNPVHLAVIYAAFINDGNILTPRLIYSSTALPTVWKPNAISPETARIVLDSLIFSIEEGTGRNARIPGVTLAGKTGTAELKLTQYDEGGEELGWFVLFTADEDAENPLLVVSMVEGVQGRGGSGYVVPRVAALFR